MKGIILAGGSGTRLYPLTEVVSKQLLPIGDKPMIYYPLSVLMLAGIKEILIISTPHDLPNFKKLFASGNHLGLKISYKEQPSPDGLAQAFIIGQDFIGNDDVCLVLGDNIFYSDGFSELLKESVKSINKKDDAIIFGYNVHNPKDYGIVEFDKDGSVLSLEEKPNDPKSNFAIVGLYFYPNDVIKMAKNVKPSHRGELEITSINDFYLNKKRLKVELLGRGFAWLDTGTHKSMLSASNYISSIEERQGLKIACIEEIALNEGYITKKQFDKLVGRNIKSDYGKYLKKLI
tara:strand:+ start:261 stop:1130 length:870 start_codon:yes stop_codon:yes gene_type:complete